MWSGMTLKRLKANAIPTSVNTSRPRPSDTVLPLDIQCHPFVNGTSSDQRECSASETVSSDDSEETTLVSPVIPDECINGMSEASRLATEIDSPADIILHEHTYSRAGVYCKSLLLFY